MPGPLVCSDTVELFFQSLYNNSPVQWLWYPYIPLGKLTVIQGDPGEGKTTFVLAMIAALTKGEALPEREPLDPVNILYQTAEDGLADTIRPRLDALGADCSRVLVIDESKRELSLSDERIRQAMEKTGAKLLVLDPLQAYLGAEVDMHRANEVRPILKRLGSVAEQMGCAVILIRHLNKMQGQKSGHRGMGSVDFQAAARSVLLVGRTKEDPQLRIVVPDKSSLAPEGESTAFALDPEQGFQWKGYCAYNAEELLGGSTKQVQTKTMQAEETLRNLLDKPAPAEEILRRITAVGISERTLMTAKKNLGVLSEKRGGQWFWRLPSGQGCKDVIH